MIRAHTSPSPFVEPVRYLLAEMYAYSMAAANLTLPHAQVHQLMVSNVGAGGEGWDWIDSTADSVCAGATLTQPPSNTRVDAQAKFTNDEHAPGPAAPSVVHFCQSYRLAGLKFGKHSVAHNTFSCDPEMGLFKFDPQPLATAAKTGTLAEVRAAFFLCNILPRLNDALLRYKREVCPQRGIMTWNEQPTLSA